MNAAPELKRALGTEVVVFTVLTIGSTWVAYNGIFTAFALIALISLPFSVLGFAYSVHALREQRNIRTRLALWGSVVLVLGAFVIGFLGYAAGV
jgi:hypothetical protein